MPIDHRGHCIAHALLYASLTPNVEGETAIPRLASELYLSQRLDLQPPVTEAEILQALERPLGQVLGLTDHRWQLIDLVLDLIGNVESEEIGRRELARLEAIVGGPLLARLVTCGNWWGQEET